MSDNWDLLSILHHSSQAAADLSHEHFLSRRDFKGEHGWKFCPVCGKQIRGE
tara:strand:+ start:178 stop:333 length:156 start_codon:yes stop_codon:yes gene_type:complete